MGTTILVAADAKWVRDQVRAAFVGPDQRVVEVTRGQDVRDAVRARTPDLVILDLQIGNMGGIAVAIDLRLEESADRLAAPTILLLLDREADKFLGRRADVDVMLVKPVDAGVLRRAAKQLLEPAPRLVRTTHAWTTTRSQRQAARRAGDFLVELRARGGTGAEGDRQANDLILPFLREHRPDDAILSEESKDDPDAHRRASACGSSTRSTARASTARPGAPTGRCTSRSS